MFSFNNLFISAAMAQEAAPPAETAQATMMQYVPFVLIFAVFYVLVIRPQQKKLADQDKMIKALKRGDRVVTSGGIHGKVSSLEGETQVILEIAAGVEIKVEKENILSLESKPQPVEAK